MPRLVKYKAQPTAAKAHQSTKVVRGFMGPVGNGKSVWAICELIRLAHCQAPNADGIRKSRWAIVRNTNPELRSTTLNTWKQWMPEEVCPITLSPMIIAKYNQPVGDGTWAEMEVYFLALDLDKDVRKLLSLELTGGFINEAREISFGVVKAMRERIGRYPALVDGYEDDETKGYKGPRDADGEYQPCTRKALLMDTNPPDDDHWWYQLAEEKCLRSTRPEQKAFAISETERVFDFFRGPSPLIKHEDGTYTPNPNAENIAHLPGGYDYYLDMIAGNTEDHVNVMVMGNYGHLATGKPVYPDYNDQLHCPKQGIVPLKGVPIALGWDFGLTPAVAIGQLTDLGQLLILDELVADPNGTMGVREFARDIVKPFLARHYGDYEIEFSFGDPAGSYRGESEAKSAIGILNDEYVMNDDGDIIQPLEMGFYTEPAPCGNNDMTIRLDAVKHFMGKIVSGGYPGYVLNVKCKMLRKGKLGGYKYKKLQVSGEDRYNLKPDKNEYSHVADAEQYLAIGYYRGLHNVGSDYDEDYEYQQDEEVGAGGY